MKTETCFTARYSETDQMGIIHHSNYAVWFEVGRTDFLKKAKIPNSIIEEKGVLLPLYEMNCKYKNAAKYEDEILVTTYLKHLSCARMIFEYQVWNTSNNKLLATGETMHAWTDKNLVPVNAQKIIPEILAILNTLI